jgi:hypothetical protein
MTPRLTTTPFLRRALLADAAFSGAAGFLLLASAALLAPLLGLPSALLSWTGALLLPWAAVVCWLGLRPGLPVAAVLGVVALNAAWVVASLLLLVSGWVQPGTLGVAAVIIQAVVVAIFAEVQAIALFRARRIAPVAA